MSAIPIGMPGWPEAACSTASMLNARMALASVRGAGIGPEEEGFSGGVIDRVRIFPEVGKLANFGHGKYACVAICRTKNGTIRPVILSIPAFLLSMPSRIHSFFPGVLLATLSLCAYAESEPPHPVVDIPRTTAPSAESLQDSTISELRTQRETYAEQLDTASALSIEELEKQLLHALLVYDDERIQIIDLIPQIIKHYEVEGTLKEDLMNFRRTLIKIVEELRPEVTTLQRYKPYDFRLGVSYAAMMTIMQRKQVIRDSDAAGSWESRDDTRPALPAPEGNLSLGPGSARAAGTSLSG